MRFKGTSQDILNAAALVRSPLREGSFGEICVAISGTAITLAIPSWAKGCYCEFTTEGAAADIHESSASTVATVTAAVYNQASTVDGSTKVITTVAATGRHVNNGAVKSWLVSPNSTYWSIIASGSGFLYIAVTSQQIAENP